jgi:hypothetical protein
MEAKFQSIANRKAEQRKREEEFGRNRDSQKNHGKVNRNAEREKH